MNAGRAIIQNFFNLSAGELIARLVSLAAFAHLARVLGSGDFGRIGFVVTVATYLVIPVMQGFDSVGIRDVARDPDRLPRYAGSIIAIRLVAALVTWAALVLIVIVLHPAPPLGTLLLLFGLAVFPNAISLKWAFQAVERTRAVAVAGILAQFIFAAGSFTVRGPGQLLMVPVYSVVGEASGALLLICLFLSRFGSLRPAWEWPLWKELVRESAPLAASTVLGTLLFNFDVLALEHFQGSSAVGLYTAVYKLVLLFATVLTLFQLSLFPTLARAYTSGRDLQPMAAQVLHFVAAAFVPLAFAGAWLAKPLLELLFGPEYGSGALTLGILMCSLPLMALRSVFRIMLVSYNLQRLDMRAVLAGTLTNIVLDLALAAKLSTVGTAISTLTSEAVILALSYRYVWRRIEPIGVVRHCLRPLAASLVMLAAAHAIGGAPLFMQAAVAGTAYIAALLLLRGLAWKEIAALYRS